MTSEHLRSYSSPKAPVADRGDDGQLQGRPLLATEKRKSLLVAGSAARQIEFTTTPLAYARTHRRHSDRCRHDRARPRHQWLGHDGRGPGVLMFMDLRGIWPPHRLGSLMAGVGPIPGRAALADTATILFASHSFGQTAYGTPVLPNGDPDPFGGILDAQWPGTALSDYVSYGSLEAVRALNGHLRNSDYDAVIVAEFTDPRGTGFAAFDSPTGRNSLQQAYWDGLDAQARGAEIIIQDIWEPMGRTDLYANATGFSQGLRAWLQDKLGQRVWIIPAFPFVGAMRDAYGDAIYEDGLHLGRSSAYARGMSYLVYSFLTQARCPFVVPGDEAIDQMAWDTLQAYECAGMGGTIPYVSTMEGDPLPDPLPL